MTDPTRAGFVARALVAAYTGGLEPILCLTKGDLDDPSVFAAEFAAALSAALGVALVEAHEDGGVHQAIGQRHHHQRAHRAGRQRDQQRRQRQQRGQRVGQHMGVGGAHAVQPGEGRDQHEQGRARQVEIRHQPAGDGEAVAGADEDVGRPVEGPDGAVRGRGALDQAEGGGADGDHAPPLGPGAGELRTEAGGGEACLGTGEVQPHQ